MQSYHHFTLEDRENLAQMLLSGEKQQAIARKLGKSPSSISRELKRNRGRNGQYKPLQATVLYLHRRKKSKRSYRLRTDTELRAYVKRCLRKYWSPEAITATWKRKHPGGKLSASTIYRGIKRGDLEGCEAEKVLRRRGRRKYGKRERFNTIHPEHTIHDRPLPAQGRERIGDFEGDTIMGLGKKSCLFTAVDRKSRYLCAQIALGRSASAVGEAMVRALKDRPVKTLTLDNGSEFAGFRDIQARLETTIYFADPHAPWQRPSNENVNGLLRFFFPKNFDFRSCSQHDLDLVLTLINNRPRKCLGWLAPADIFLSKCCT